LGLILILGKLMLRGYVGFRGLEFSKITYITYLCPKGFRFSKIKERERERKERDRERACIV